MHHHKTYMYINFQQNCANRSVITAHTNVSAKNRKLHKRRTGGQHDGRTDRQTSRTTTIGSFFEKKVPKTNARECKVAIAGYS